MQEFTGPLGELIRRLDAFPGHPPLVQLINAIKESKLRLEDVAQYVKESDRTYHRALVVRREFYELLVLTWRPGQGSVPHDHAGSVSAMVVLEGQAAEGSWRIMTDGYADFDFESLLNQGEFTAWQDAGVHSIRNPSPDKTLVTLNVYSPPLQDFRRYNARPQSVRTGSDTLPDKPTVVIVGGGFSGAITAAQLLKRSNLARFPLQVVLVERQGAIGEGVAYGTHDANHLLNVPIGRMSAWPDMPNDFHQWVTNRYGAHAPTDFVPRGWYGAYVRETLLKAANEPDRTAKLIVTYDEVRRVSKRPDKGWMVSFAKNISTACDSVVLAIGHRAPTDPIGSNWSGPRIRFIADPWQPFSSNNIAPNEPVVILGTGLTAIDTVLSLSNTPRSAPITLISRRGLMPQVHSPNTIVPLDWNAYIKGLDGKSLPIAALAREIRTRVKAIEGDGGDWRSVIDGLRPHIASLWQLLPERERRRFLTHLRSFWEIHRHRTAIAVARRFEDLKSSGLVRVIAGRIVAAQANEQRVRMFVRERGDDRSLEISSDWVINCTGPSAANSPDSNPVIGSLLIHDWATPDPLSLGLETTDDGNVLDGNGNVTPNLFVVGTLRKPNAWESTAVPELRVQAANVAESVLTQFSQELRYNSGSTWMI